MRRRHGPGSGARRASSHAPHPSKPGSFQIHWPDRYVPLFGAGAFDPGNDRPDAVPFEEQLEGLQAVVDAGKASEVARGGRVGV